MMIPGFVTIIVMKCHMYDRKKIRSAQNVTDVSFFVLLPSKIKKMGFISYCMSLSLYIMSSCLKCYSILMNLIL